VRVQAARALGAIADAAATDPLLAALGQDTAIDVRTEAARALGAIGNRAATDALTSVLDDHRDVVLRAMEALERIADPRCIDVVVRKLEDADSNVGRAAFRILAAIDDPRTVDSLIEGLGHAQPFSHFSHQVAKALVAKNDARAVEPLVSAAVAHSDIELAAAAVALDRDAAVELLLVALRDGPEDVRCNSAALLGFVRASAAAPALRAAVRSSSDALRRLAVSALGDIRDRDSVQVLVTALDDPDAGVRHRSAEALARDTSTNPTVCFQ
jgi:HEAT repeat protein